MNSDILLKIEDIFEEKKWDRESVLYTRFIACMEKLNEIEQKCMLELTEKYTYISLGQYEDLIRGLFKKASDENLLRRKIYIVPLLEYTGNFVQEMKQVKSSNFIAYLTKSTFLQYEDWIKGKNMNVYNFLTQAEINEINEKSSLVIFIDDYIGSGKTALKCIDAYTEKGLELENILVMSLFVDKLAKDKFEQRQISFIETDIEYSRIEDFGDETIIETLKSVAKKIKLPNDSIEYPMGYESTGALISLVRTPNNTLPFFWSTRKGRKAPFPR